MNDDEFSFSDVENIDYRKPRSEFDDAFESLKQAAQNLVEHKIGRQYTEKAEEYLRAALPLVRMVRSDESARQRLEMLATTSKVDVRRHAQNRDTLKLFKLSQKRVGRATTAAERNKWASILTRGLKEGLDADALIEKVNRLGGINKAASAFREIPDEDTGDRENASSGEAVQQAVVVKLVVSGFDDEVEIGGYVPAAIAETISKRLRAALIVGGAQ